MQLPVTPKSSPKALLLSLLSFLNCSISSGVQVCISKSYTNIVRKSRIIFSAQFKAQWFVDCLLLRVSYIGYRTYNLMASSYFIAFKILQGVFIAGIL